MRFTRLDSSADATPAVMLSPAAATCWRSMTMNPSCHGNRRARYNCSGVTTDDSNRARIFFPQRVLSGHYLVRWVRVKG